MIHQPQGVKRSKEMGGWWRDLFSFPTLVYQVSAYKRKKVMKEQRLDP